MFQLYIRRRRHELSLILIHVCVYLTPRRHESLLIPVGKLACCISKTNRKVVVVERVGVNKKTAFSKANKVQTAKVKQNINYCGLVNVAINQRSRKCNVNTNKSTLEWPLFLHRSAFAQIFFCHYETAWVSITPFHDKCIVDVKRSWNIAIQFCVWGRWKICHMDKR